MSMINGNSHIAPVAAAGVSCIIGFDLHTALGYIGQMVGILSGVLSILWVGFQVLREMRKNAKVK